MSVNTPNVAQRLVSICGPCGVRYKNMVWHELKLTPEAFKQPLLFDNEFGGAANLLQYLTALKPLKAPCWDSSNSFLTHHYRLLVSPLTLIFSLSLIE